MAETHSEVLPRGGIVSQNGLGRTLSLALKKKSRRARNLVARMPKAAYFSKLSGINNTSLCKRPQN